MSATLYGCDKDDEPSASNKKIIISQVSVNGQGLVNGATLQNVPANPAPQITISLQEEIDPACFTKNTVSITPTLDFNYSMPDNQTITLQITTTPASLTSYTIYIAQGVNSAGGNVVNPYTGTFVTQINDSDKYPRIPDDELLTKVQRATFKYFWDYANPTSGLIREGSTHGQEISTIGGSGFGIAAIPVGIHRGFITRADGLARMHKIVEFLLETADTFHGAFPHWINGNTGRIIPFGTKDNGADLVETAFLIEGLLIAREYFDSTTDGGEIALREDITAIYDRVEWDWFRRGGQNVLYWHWSPTYGWDMNMKIQGWNEGLMVYVLAAGSSTHPIPKEVYDLGWARNGNMRNGNKYYGTTLPLGEAYGGPLFFAHYSFIGLDPRNLSDQYANYWEQNTAHSKINHDYCQDNPRNYAGYGDECWGLTASNIPGGYTASSPTNDRGTIAPTAALGSMPYTPDESMAALRYFYYKLGDKLFNESKYGFYDAFDIGDRWWATNYLAIDQGPIVCMIENHRSGLLWDAFMKAPEIQAGLATLGFSTEQAND